MKNCLIFFASIILISCTTNKKIIEKKSEYMVTKLDSINNYYLIYATKNDSVFEIISKKERTAKCKTIKKGSNYSFKLKSMRDNAHTIGGIKISPMNYLDIQCFQFDENTKICKEEGIYDLYFAKNINGLCFKK